MKMLKILLYSLIILIFYVSCSKVTKEDKVSPVKIERCKDCIYLSDFNDYEIKLGSKPIYFTKYSYCEKSIIECFAGGEFDFDLGTKYHFYLRDNKNNSLNTIVCYITKEYSENENIVEFEVFKIFIEDTYLDREGIAYMPKGNYKTLKNYFKGLVTHLPDSLMQRPENYYKVNSNAKDNQDYFEYKEDMVFYEYEPNKLGEIEYYTLTLNREDSDYSKAFWDKQKLYRLRDMAVYTAYFSEVPSAFFYRAGSEYYSIKNIEWYVNTEKQDSIELGKASFKSFYDSLSNKTKTKIDIIRKKRGEIPIQDFFDSVKVYKKMIKREQL